MLMGKVGLHDQLQVQPQIYACMYRNTQGYMSISNDNWMCWMFIEIS